MDSSRAAGRRVNGATPHDRELPDPAITGFRHFLRPPRNDERFTVNGAAPQANWEETRRLMGGLAKCMAKAAPATWPSRLPYAEEDWENPAVPAGYTYLAQLAVHDLVHSVEAPPGDTAAALTLRNDRVSRLTLDTIYGSGPMGCPHAYMLAPPHQPRTRLRLGPIKDVQGPTALRDVSRVKPPTVPHEAAAAVGAETAIGRKRYTEPLIADPRNDDNLILAQLTAVFHLLHNCVMDQLEQIQPADTPEAARNHFQFAREAVTTTFRTCVRDDLLARILHPDIFRAYRDGQPLIDCQKGGIPLEFSHAAARFGHAMVRPNYRLGDAPTGERLSLDDLLWFNSEHMPADFPLAHEFVIRWSRFFKVTDETPQASSRIGPQMQSFGAIMPSDVSSLAERDLLRGAAAGLWSVWALRKAIESAAGGVTGLCKLLTEPCVARDAIRKFLVDCGLDAKDAELIAKDPPLAFYVLFEASQQPQGQQLGVLGSTIVAEVVFGALATVGSRDLKSVAGQLYPTASAELDRLTDALADIAHMPDLIRFVAERANLAGTQPPFI